MTALVEEPPFVAPDPLADGTEDSSPVQLPGPVPAPDPEPVHTPVSGQDEAPASPAYRYDRLLVVGAVAVVVAGITLRFVATSGMWLDEALTSDIARLPLSQLHAALLRDGSPPLYYVLLHFWMGAFGSSAFAERALAGVMSCATLPLVWVAARRIGGRAMAICALVVVATSPFAVDYATENRMYSLVMLLVAAGVVALGSSIRRPTRSNLLAVGAVCALLLYSHYWSIYLVGATGIWLSHQAWRGPEPRRRGARLSLVAMMAGCVAFAPWLATFVFQVRHTGSPWAGTGSFAVVYDSLTSLAGAPTYQGWALAAVYLGLLLLVLIGVARGGRHVDLALRANEKVLALAVFATLALALVGGYLSDSAFQARYASVVFVLMALVLALGLGSFTGKRARAGALVVVAALGLATSLPNAWTSRTEAGQVAAALARSARPGDLVAFCPDQLGPAVSVLLPDGRYGTITFPRSTPATLVDWVDYAKATETASPAAFASHLEQMARDGQTIWLVWAPGYQTFGFKCQEIYSDLGSDPRLRGSLVLPFRHVDNSWVAYEGMELLRFTSASR